MRYLLLICAIALAASSAAAEDRVQYVTPEPLPLSAKLLVGNGQVMADFYKAVRELNAKIAEQKQELEEAHTAYGTLHNACIHDTAYRIRIYNPNAGTWEEEESLEGPNVNSFKSPGVAPGSQPR